MTVSRVVVVGSGGREDALAATLARTTEVVVTPGNPGIPGSVATPPTDLDADLFVVGPEQPLVDGLADRLRADGKLVFGPGADGARIEGSKRWMKELLVDAGVPTARHASFTADRLDDALAHLARMGDLFVVKTDGLAAGKGVLVTADRTAAADDVRAKLSGDAFGSAGTTVVIEEGLSGPELSLFAICDGSTALVLDSPSQDHKRVGDGDTGPNTGGMGAYTPVPGVDSSLVADVTTSAIEPTLAALRRRGIDYRGVLYAGLMLTPDGPKMLEYNVRFGDPEAQVVLPRLSPTTDLAALLAEAAGGRLEGDADFSDDALLLVVCASEGYPTSTRTGDVIVGLDEARAVDGAAVYCAGVDRDERGRLVTAGGRVLNVVGRGADLGQAQRRAYEAVGRLSWPGMHHRSDIGARALAGQRDAGALAGQRESTP